MSKMKELDEIAQGVADVTMELMYESIDWKIADFPQDGDDDFYQIHEVYYNGKDEVHAWTVKGATVGGSNIAEVKWTLMEMLSCLERDVIKDK